jgi:hypothetical protein
MPGLSRPTLILSQQMLSFHSLTPTALAKSGCPVRGHKNFITIFSLE